MDDRVRVAYQLRTKFNVPRMLFYQCIWLWPAPEAPNGEGLGQPLELVIHYHTEFGHRSSFKHLYQVWSWTFGDQLGVLLAIRPPYDGNWIPPYHPVCCLCDQWPTRDIPLQLYGTKQYRICTCCAESIGDGNYDSFFG